MATPKVWIDGHVVPSPQAVVSVHDRAFRSGEGVFETLRAYGDHPFRADAHVQRAVAGAAAIGIDLTATTLHRGLDELLAANAEIFAGRDSVLRLTASAGEIDPDSVFPGTPASGARGEPTIVVTSHRFQDDPRLTREGVRAVTLPMAREMPEVKAVSYLVAVAARQMAAARGVDEALLTSPDGMLLEAASANLAVVRNGVLVTPPVESGVLAGVTRKVMIEVAGRAGLGVDERPVHRGELAAADEAVLTATTREIIPLVEVDGEPVGDGRPGAASAALLAAYHAEVARERAAAGR